MAGPCLVGAIVIIAVALPVLAAAPTGLNLPRLDVAAPHYGGSWASASSAVFTNLFKHSTPFECQSRGKGSTGPWGWGPGEALTWRPDGYPAEIKSLNTWSEYCAVARVGAGAAYYSAGKYVLLYSGDGKVTLEGDATVIAESAGRLELTLRPAAGMKRRRQACPTCGSQSGFAVRIVRTNITNPVRNISIVPAAAEFTFADQPYQASFLELVKGFDVLRFTWWQRIWGDARNAQMNRALPKRATPASQTYLAKDGVSWQDMVALANQVGADPWFNLPLATSDSDPYATAMASYVAQNLAPERKVYIEYGFAAPGWMTTEYPTNLLRVARIWRAAFTAAGLNSKRVVVVATYEVPAWIPYLANTFGASISQVDAVAVVGSYGSYRSWNSNRPCFYEFSSNTFAQEPKNADIDLACVLQLTRSSVIHADLLHNSWHQRVKAMGKRFIAVQGGPDRTQMAAAYYSMRQNYNNILGCRSYPCTRTGLFPPANPSSIYFASEAERNATLAQFWPQAQNEWKLDELLMQVKLRDATTKQHMLDHLWRWDSMGGGNGDLMMVDLPPPLACSSAPLGSLLPPKECQPGSGISNAASPTDSPIYQAVRAYQAGQKGALLLASNWSALEGSACDPECQYGTCVKGKCACWAGYSGATCSSKVSRPNQCNTKVGLNLEGVRDWMHSWAFVDVMKAGRGWLAQGMDGSGGWGNFSGVALDSSGWVTKLWDNMKAGTMMIRDLQGHVPAGTYTITYDGEGIIDCSMDVDVVRQLEAGRIEVDLKPSTNFNNGLYCTLERTSPANPVRNIRVLMPGFDAQTAAAVPFHPRFVKYVQNFGVLRFMGWMEANTNQEPRTWQERAKPTDRSYAGVNLGGVPVEHMVLLANMVGAAPWFSMPHLADDAYHRSFAQYVKANLRPDAKVYVEWSNEVWHTGFAGGQYAQAEGVRLGMNEEGPKWYGGATNEARLCYYSERTKNMSIIWKEVFGDQRDRVVVVAQGQAVWPLTSDKILKCRNATSHIDALAVAPYFGSYSASRDTNMATYLGTTLPAQVDAAVSSVTAHADIAAKYGKPLITYEAGSSIDGTTTFAAQANRDPAMYGLYQRYYAGLAKAGVQLITQFDSMGGTTWGLSEWQDQDSKTAPKLQAVQGYIAANANASSCSSSGSDGSSSDGNSTNPGKPGGSCPNDCWGNGECLDSKCFCNTGFSGPDCNTTSPTEVYQCGYKCTFDQGVCKPTSLIGSTQYYGCSCTPQFSGLTCSLFSCPSNCSWSGTCLEPGLCACWPGFTGTACEIDCGCNGHGMCAPENTCACDQGYKLGPSGCEPECYGCGAGSSCIAPGECGCSSCKYGSCFNGRCECWAGHTGKACDVAAPDSQPNAKSPMGIEVSGPAYYSSQWIWIDAMKQSSAWMTQALPDTSLSSAFDSQDPLTLTPDGDPAALPPGKLAHKLLLRNLQLHAMPGRWLCLYDGEGSIDLQFDAKVASVGKGRIEFDYLPTANMPCHATGAAYCGDNGISLRITATNPANPVRNIRLLPPGFEGAAERQIFHPWFLKSLERFSVLRFMSWLNTNSDSLLPWEARVTPAAASQAHNAGGGVALEYIVELCNRLGASPWINVHHLADDSYVRKMAAFLKDRLRPDLRVYVEHSNEVWNQAFPQGKYARERGLAQGLAAAPDMAGYAYHGKRSAEIWAIFKDVFGSSPTRLQNILSTWGFVCSGSWGTGCGVTALNSSLSYAGVAAAADAVAVTGYYDCGLGQNPTLEAQMSVDALITQCLSEVQLNKTRDSLLTLKALAAKFNLPLTTYEAGPSIVEGSVIFNGGGTAGAADKYIALQRDPRFQQVYEAYLALFDSIGLISEARPFMHFASAGLPSKYGSWGLIEYTGQPASTAPKYRAVIAMLDKKQPADLYANCLGPQKGAAGLGDGSFAGVPAVTFPRKGSVMIQGITYNITMPASHTSPGDLTLSLFQDTDCNDAKPLATSGPVKPQTLGFDSYIPFTVPASVEGSGFVIRIENPATGQRNYSEVFVVQKLQVQGSAGGCVVNPLLPPSQPFVKPPNRCNPEYKWNISSLPTGICEVMPNGGRYYRTSNKAGAWYSIGKPVYDYSAQYSPSPSYAALAAAGVPVGPLKPGQPC